MMEPTSYSNSTKLQPPSKLPEEVTALQFKPRRSLMETFLQQYRQNIVFFPAPPRAVALNRMKEGIYSQWRDSATYGIYGRIEKLHDSDKTTEKSRRAIEMGIESGAYVRPQLAANGATLPNTGVWRDQVEKQRILDDLDDEKLFERNRDLSVVLAHITNACSVNEADDLTHRSVSLDWIWDYLLKHYNIAPKGANFLRIASISYSSEEKPYSFYKRLRAAFIDNLRKAGAKDDSRWSNAVLGADERLSPSFEDTIILIALKEIDPRLPAKVRRDYEHQLNQDNYLSDIHPQIFQAVPIMLQDLDGAAQAASLQASLAAAFPLPLHPHQPADGHQGFDLQAFNSRGGGGRGGRRSYGTAPSSQRGGGGGNSGRGGGQGGRIWYPIYCSKCKGEGKPPSVFSTHWTSECKSLSSLSLEDKKDLVQGILASMTLGDGDYDQYDGQEPARTYPSDPYSTSQAQDGGDQQPQGQNSSS